MIRVAVAGALGRMGRVARIALHDAADMSYAGGFARTASTGEGIVDDFDVLLEGEPDVLLDLTTHPSTVELSMRALERGVRPVIGATGWTQAECNALAVRAAQRRTGAMLVPNFSLGAALMMRFAQQAARFFPTVEIVEMHHDAKKDAPSGTARLTAERIRSQTKTEVPIHSVRLRGLGAHQEVLFGNDGELLTLRHDAFGRDAYVRGMLAAIRGVMGQSELTIGLDALLDAKP
ncbi:MAG: 4-hydroxy-tetrahydrodipicolinate reductase [Candidatus Eremiobacteraeota bacterium]|nr:4-hydroxy-tetrahydrodipicolinate reductase [Candidatus Eremiobacteraeota bacterium]